MTLLFCFFCTFRCTPVFLLIRNAASNRWSFSNYVVAIKKTTICEANTHTPFPHHFCLSGALVRLSVGSGCFGVWRGCRWRWLYLLVPVTLRKSSLFDCRSISLLSPQSRQWWCAHRVRIKAVISTTWIISGDYFPLYSIPSHRARWLHSQPTPCPFFFFHRRTEFFRLWCSQKALDTKALRSLQIFISCFSRFRKQMTSKLACKFS